MNVEDGQNDQVLTAIASLKTYDVSRRHTTRLRHRCHARLRSERPPGTSGARSEATIFERSIGPALGGAWCLAYLVEIVRRAAGYFGTQ